MSKVILDELLDEEKPTEKVVGSFVNWKSIARLKFKQLYPELIEFYKNGILPDKSKMAVYRFQKHAQMFTYEPDKDPSKDGRIFLIALNLEDESLKGIVDIPIKLELINPTDENISSIVVDL